MRLLLAALGSVIGQTYWTLVVPGAISYLVVIWRLWLVYHERETVSGSTGAGA